MFQVALVGLLAGSLSIGTPDTGGDDKKTPHADKSAAAAAAPDAGASIFGTPDVLTESDVRTITQDTWAFGLPSDASPIKFWASYAYGDAEGIYDLQGDSGGDAEEIQVAFTDGDLVSQRVNVGAQINFISFSAFKLGAGGQLTVAKNEFKVGEQGANNPPGVPAGGFVSGDIESDFGLQNIKVFGSARGRVVGLHGGYIFDIGDEGEFGAPDLTGDGQGDIPTTLSNSDGRDALFFGADFDYPSDRVRLFGGIDYYHLYRTETNQNRDDDIWNFLFGAGVKFSVFELGAALQILTRLDNPTVENIGTTSGIGGHAGTIAPYLRISPPSLPVSIFLKGAVQEEYTEYGYQIGGANSVKPSFGGTIGVTLGFE